MGLLKQTRGYSFSLPGLSNSFLPYQESLCFPELSWIFIVIPKISELLDWDPVGPSDFLAS